MRLQFQAPNFDALQDVLGTALKGFTITKTDVIFSRDMILVETESGKKPLFQGSIAFGVECSVKGAGSNDPEVLTTAGIELSESSMSLTFKFESKDPLSGILKWLTSLIGDDTLQPFVDDLLNKEEGGTKLFSDFILRRMTVTLDTRDSAQRTLSSFSFDIEAAASFGKESNSNTVVFLVSYNWDRVAGGFGQLTGRLWNGE